LQSDEPEFAAAQATVRTQPSLLDIKVTFIISKCLTREIQVQEPAKEVFKGDDARNDDPVHEPWSQLVLVICFESLVTRKYRE